MFTARYVLHSTFCPHSIFMRFVWIWEQTAIISLYSINWLVFITETECVYCAVRTGSLTTLHVNFHSYRIKILLSHLYLFLLQYVFATDYFKVADGVRFAAEFLHKTVNELSPEFCVPRPSHRPWFVDPSKWRLQITPPVFALTVCHQHKHSTLVSPHLLRRNIFHLIKTKNAGRRPNCCVLDMT